MAKQGEIDYLRNLERAISFTPLGSPSPAPKRPAYSVEIGTVMSLLPPRPRGCSTSAAHRRTSVFFARTGYEVVGVTLPGHDPLTPTRSGSRKGCPTCASRCLDYEKMAKFDTNSTGVVFSTRWGTMPSMRSWPFAVVPGPQTARRAASPRSRKGHQDAPHSLAAVRQVQRHGEGHAAEKIIALGARPARQERYLSNMPSICMPGVHREQRADPTTARPPVHPNPLRRLLGKLKSGRRRVKAVVLCEHQAMQIEGMWKRYRCLRSRPGGQGDDLFRAACPSPVTLNLRTAARE